MKDLRSQKLVSLRSGGKEGCQGFQEVQSLVAPSNGGVIGRCYVMQLVAEGESGFPAEVGTRP